MATITHVASIWNTTAGNKTLASAFTPAAGDLIVVVAASTGVATSIVSDTNADGLGTYSQVTATFTGWSSAATGNLNIWIRDALIGSATSMNITATQTSSTGGGFDVFRVSGMSKASFAACLQSAGQSAHAAGTPAPGFSATPQSTNPIIGAVANGTSPATMTPRTGYTEATDVGYSTPTSGLETMFLNSGETSAAITWGSSSASVFGSVAVELDASLPGTIPNVVMAPMRG